MSALLDSEIILCSVGGRLRSASSDGGILSVLTYPVPDIAGDYVRPDGGDLSRYPIPFGQPGSYAGPLANWGHDVPIGRGEVVLKGLQYKDQTTRVLVSTTHPAHSAADLEGLDLRRRNPKTHRSWDREPPYTTDEVLKYAGQAERLIRDEIAIGTSIEFDTNKDKRGVEWWDLNSKSLLDNRPARHFEKWTFLAYAHARQPVNPGCMTLASDPKGLASIEKCIRIAETGKLPGGEVLEPVILKAFTDLKGLTIDNRGQVKKAPTYVTVPSQVPGRSQTHSGSATGSVASDTPATTSSSGQGATPAGAADLGSLDAAAVKSASKLLRAKQVSRSARLTSHIARSSSRRARAHDDYGGEYAGGEHHDYAATDHGIAHGWHQEAAKLYTGEKAAKHNRLAKQHLRKALYHRRKDSMMRKSVQQTGTITVKDCGIHAATAHRYSERAHKLGASANVKNSYFSHSKARIAHERAHDAHARAASAFRKAGDTGNAEQHEGAAMAHADHVARHHTQRLQAKRSRWYKAVDADTDVVVKGNDNHGLKLSNAAYESSHAAHKSSRGSLSKGRHAGHEASNKAMQHTDHLHTALSRGESRNNIAVHHGAVAEHHEFAAHHHEQAGDTEAAKAHSDAADKHRQAQMHYHTVKVKSMATDTNGVVIKGYGDTSGQQKPQQQPQGQQPSSQENPGPQPGMGYKAHMNFVQALMDCCGTFDNEAGQSDAMEVRKSSKKFTDMIRKMAEKVKLAAERHHSKLNGKSGVKEMDDDEEDEDEKKEKAIEVDADGTVVVKSFPHWKPRRFTAKNIVDIAPAPAPEPKVELVSPEEEAAALEKLAKAKRAAQHLLDAATANGRI